MTGDLNGHISTLTSSYMYVVLSDHNGTAGLLFEDGQAGIYVMSVSVPYSFETVLYSYEPAERLFLVTLSDCSSALLCSSNHSLI